MVGLHRAAIANNFRRQTQRDPRPAVKAVRQGQQGALTGLGRFPGRLAGAKAFAAAQNLFDVMILLHAGDDDRQRQSSR